MNAELTPRQMAEQLLKQHRFEVVFEEPTFIYSVDGSYVSAEQMLKLLESQMEKLQKLDELTKKMAEIINSLVVDPD